MSYITSADVVTFNENQMPEGVVDALFDRSPLVKNLYAKSTVGEYFKYVQQTVASSGGFRVVNAGLAQTAPTMGQVRINLGVLDASWMVDAGAMLGAKDPEFLTSQYTMAALRQANCVLEGSIFT